MRSILIKNIISILFNIANAAKESAYKTKRNLAKVFTFHRIGPSSSCFNSTIIISKILFLEILEYIRCKYDIITPFQLCELARNNTSRRLALITFDDGYMDIFNNAFPILQQLSIPFTVFLTSGALDRGYTDWDRLDYSLIKMVGRTLDLSKVGISQIEVRQESISTLHSILHQALKKVGNELRLEIITEIERQAQILPLERTMLTWDQVRIMNDSGLAFFGAHTVTHPILTQISTIKAREEITGCRDRLHAELGFQPRLFAYPNGRAGDYNEKIISILKDEGFSMAFTTVPGIITSDIDWFEVNRFDVTQENCVSTKGNLFPPRLELETSSIWNALLRAVGRR